MFSVHIINFNAAKNDKVLDNLSVNTYINFLNSIQVVNRETLHACYFRRTILSLSRFVFSEAAQAHVSRKSQRLIHEFERLTRRDSVLSYERNR